MCLKRPIYIYVLKTYCDTLPITCHVVPISRVKHCSTQVVCAREQLLADRRINGATHNVVPCHTSHSLIDAHEPVMRCVKKDHKWMFPKIGVYIPPNHPMFNRVGTIIFTIHFGGKIPLFLVQHPFLNKIGTKRYDNPEKDGHLDR